MKRRILALVVSTVFIALIWPNPAVSNSPPDRRFGMTEAFWQPKEAAELGVGWERILFYWRELQPEGPDDWNTLHVLEEWLIEADTQGRTVVGLLKNTAPWASEDGTEAGLPKGLYLATDDPNNLWASFVRKTARYYGQRNVKNWIIWNEPEIRPGVFGFEFAGDVSDYYQLLKVAYKVIKEEQPDATIHLAGLTWWHDQSFLDRFITAAMSDPEAEKNNYFFDIISLHIYFRAETIPIVLNAVNRIQTKYGLDKPIWINETNAPPNKDPEWPVNRPDFEIDLEQQAWFIIQAFALGFASGAESVSVYKLIDIHLTQGEESFGLLRPDFSRRPAFDAYKIATETMYHFRQTHLEKTDRYYQVTFERPQGITRVLWTRTPESVVVPIPAESNTANLFGSTGEVSQIFPSAGTYRLELSGAKCSGECLVGGAPLILKEAHSGYSLNSTRAIQRLTDLASTITDEILPKIDFGALHSPQIMETPTAAVELLSTPQKADQATKSQSEEGFALSNSVAQTNLSPTDAIEKTPTYSLSPGHDIVVVEGENNLLLWLAIGGFIATVSIGLIILLRSKTRETQSD